MKPVEVLEALRDLIEQAEQEGWDTNGNADVLNRIIFAACIVLALLSWAIG